MTVRAPARPAEIDVAALYLARTYGRGDTSPAALKRWAGRIHDWARRPRPGLLVHQYGRAGRRGIYDLAELDARAAAVVGDQDDEAGQ